MEGEAEGEAAGEAEGAMGARVEAAEAGRAAAAATNPPAFRISRRFHFPWAMMRSSITR